MTLEERLSKNPPATSKVNLKGGDKTPIAPEDEAKLKQARGGKLNTKPYSDTLK